MDLICCSDLESLVACGTTTQKNRNSQQAKDKKKQRKVPHLTGQVGVSLKGGAIHQTTCPQ